MIEKLNLQWILAVLYVVQFKQQNKNIRAVHLCFLNDVIAQNVAFVLRKMLGSLTAAADVRHLNV